MHALSLLLTHLLVCHHVMCVCDELTHWSLARMYSTAFVYFTCMYCSGLLKYLPCEVETEDVIDSLISETTTVMNMKQLITFL